MSSNLQKNLFKSSEAEGASKTIKKGPTTHVTTMSVRVDQRGDYGVHQRPSFAEPVRRDGIYANAGVQMLLEAERKYLQRVEEARKRRRDMLTKAKREAYVEIDIFKKDVEACYQALLIKRAKGEQEIAQQIQETTERNIKEMEKSFAKHKSMAVQMIDEIMTYVQAKPHQNFTLRRMAEAGEKLH